MSELKSGLEAAFIDGSVAVKREHLPEMILNKASEGKKILATLEEELRACKEFAISVAFITMSGITPLLSVFQKLEEEGIKGRILTTDYLNFTEPKALNKLNSLKNIEVKLFQVHGEKAGFHTKAYIFRREEDLYHLIIGSANMTQSALTVNEEWNAGLISKKDGSYASHMLQEYERLWESEKAKNFAEIEEAYTEQYKEAKAQKKVAQTQNIIHLQRYQLQPNSMQLACLTNFTKLMEEKAKRGLLVSSTGTGKTYSAAFVARKMQPKKLLFLVHREQIAKQAMRSFQNVLGDTKNYGLLSGNKKELEADCLFSTMQMMSKEEVYTKFEKDAFDLIIIDEAHRAGAHSYQKIMDYFTPKFYFGMTASPERTDDFNIFELFNHNIIHEIRLQEALEEDLLCPFHYFGITDLSLDEEATEQELSDFKFLSSEERVRHILQQIEYFGHGGDRVRGLIFTSSVKEGEALSKAFQEKGYRSIFLSGKDSQEAREAAVERLEGEDGPDALDYIFTVDIFNEGVDIPEVNQVVFLRATESPIVFLQQLGRGLRKTKEKEYVVILDFIGNYTNNFMIPIALSGDSSYNKDNIRRYVQEGNRIIPGSSTIHFDEISKKRIFESITKDMKTGKKFLTTAYFQMKDKLGRLPQISDFYNSNSVDPNLMVQYGNKSLKLKSYQAFAASIDEEYAKAKSFDKKENYMLEFISSYLINGKRADELEVLKGLMEKHKLVKEEIQNPAALEVLDMDFLTQTAEKEKYSKLQFFQMDKNSIEISESFENSLQNESFREEVEELISFGLRKNKDCYQGGKPFVLYEKYSRKDVARLLNWKKDESSTMYGYKINYTNHTCPIFVTYHKKADIAASTKYEDGFMDKDSFQWMTRSQVRLDSKEAAAIIHDKELKLYLFVKKDDAEGSDFYYLGQVEPKRWEQDTIINDKGKELPIVKFLFRLEESVRTDLYDYFTK